MAGETAQWLVLIVLAFGVLLLWVNRHDPH